MRWINSCTSITKVDEKVKGSEGGNDKKRRSRDCYPVIPNSLSSVSRSLSAPLIPGYLNMSWHASKVSIPGARFNTFLNRPFAFSVEDACLAVTLPFLHLFMVVFGEYSHTEVPVGGWVDLHL